MHTNNFTPNSFIGVIQVGLSLVTAPLSRRWTNTWGATAEEVQRPLPGDDLIATPQIGYTRAITINAPASAIWPWLIQLGQGRGGWYSFDGLENLIGCEIHSVDHIVPDAQLKVGDAVLFGPEEKGWPGQIVVAIEPEQTLILLGMDPATRAASDVASWVFVLDEQADGTTRLIARQRLTYSSRGESIMWHIVEPINFVMERQTLKGIKARVEASIM